MQSYALPSEELPSTRWHLTSDAVHSLASDFCCCQDDFEALDVDQNNAISKAEFLQGFAKIHPVEAVDKSPEQMLAMFDELDHDKSDTVGFGEFCDCERQRSFWRS